METYASGNRSNFCLTALFWDHFLLGQVSFFWVQQSLGQFTLDQISFGINYIGAIFLGQISVGQYFLGTGFLWVKFPLGQISVGSSFLFLGSTVLGAIYLGPNFIWDQLHWGHFFGVKFLKFCHSLGSITLDRNVLG